MVVLLFFLVFHSDQSRAEDLGPFKGCGHYEVQGFLDKDGGRQILRVYRGSIDEIDLEVVGSAAYRGENKLGQTLKLTGFMRSMVRYYRGRLLVEDYQLALPDPWKTTYGDGFKRLRAEPCQ